MRLADNADVPDRVLDAAASSYLAAAALPPSAFRALPAAQLAVCYCLSGGNWRRCELHDDGAIVIHNHPVW